MELLFKIVFDNKLFPQTSINCASFVYLFVFCLFVLHLQFSSDNFLSHNLEGFFSVIFASTIYFPAAL